MKLTEYKKNYWLLNIFQMLEIFAYQIVVLQMSIYISQDDVVGGLKWSHSVKAAIFFTWAIVQRLTPIFFGSFADKKGYKITLLTSYIFIIAGYWFMGTQVDFYPFLFGTVVLGLGSGMFKPALQGGIAHYLNSENSSRGWGIYFMLLNLAVFIAVPFSNYLKNIGWDYIFLGAAVVILINFFITLFFMEDNFKTDYQESTFKHTLKNITNPRVFWFIIIMSGFTTIYMQFYETLPNYIYDWVDSSDLVILFHLPEYALMKSPLGNMISYEWFYGINTVLVILFVTFMSKVFAKTDTTKAILIGISLSVIGLFLCGMSSIGIVLLFGIIIYTFGEMITNPQFTNFLSKMSGEDNKGTLLSFLNISFAIGLGGGAVLGGILYDHFGDKSNLAAQYLLEKYNLSIDFNASIDKLKSLTGLSDVKIKDLLWNYYHPNRFWYVFLVLGILTVIALFFYKKVFDDSKRESVKLSDNQ